jgi:hypothetical protein
MRTLRLLAVLLFAFPAFAVRFGFTLRTPTGEPVSGAEVCAFAGGESPVEQWFSGSGVDCFPASTVVAFPKGRWNVFAVVEGKYASTHPYLLVVRSFHRPSPETGRSSCRDRRRSADAAAPCGEFSHPRLTFSSQ